MYICNVIINKTINTPAQEDKVSEMVMRKLDVYRKKEDGAIVIYRYRYNISKGIIEHYVSVDGGNYFTYLLTKKKADKSKREWDYIISQLRELKKNPDIAELL